MTTVLQFCLLGLGIGSLYGVAALGMVLIYRSSGVINFAHGAVGMVGTYLYWNLRDKRDVPFVVSVGCALALCALIGFVMQRFVMHPLRASSSVSRLLATLGALAALQGAVAIKYPDEIIVVKSFLPRDAFEIGSLRIGQDRVYILVIGVVLAVGLGLFYRYTKFGIATSAVAENPRVATHLGHSPAKIAGCNWALGSALAGLAGILLAPITGLQTTALTLLVVPALAALLAGSMVSFPVTMGAGLLMGVAESLITRYVTTPGTSSAVPFVLVLIVLLVKGTSLPDRGESALRLPSVGTGAIHWKALLIAAIVGFAMLQVAPVAWVDGATVTILAGIIVLSVVVVTGYAGQVSLAQVALAGLSALIAARFVDGAGFGFLPAILASMVVAIPIGVVIGLPALRARGPNLAIATLTLSVAVEALIFRSRTWAGGDTGVSVGSANIFGFEIDHITHPRRYAIFGLLAFTLCALGLANLRRGSVGRRLIAVRANERAAASLGVSVVSAKLYAFAVSAVLAGLGGTLLAFRQPSVLVGHLHSFDAVHYVANAVIGGVGFVIGPLVGGMLETGGLGTNISRWFGDDAQKYMPVIGGIALILILIKDPDGAAASSSERVAKFGRRLRARRGAPVEVDEAARRAEIVARARAHGSARRPETLTVSGASVRFGATQALDDVSIEVRAGEVVGLIGPNGAGKTTLMDAVTGFTRMANGSVRFGDTDISGWSPRRRGAAGIARSFQSLELFEDMTVLENLLVASEEHRRTKFLTDFVRPGTPRLTPEAVAAIDRFGLWADLDRRPTEMPYGRRRLLAIARAVASEPAVLLLDEPASGLSAEQRHELSALIRSVAEEAGIGVLLIEHDVDLVLQTSDRIIALNFGATIASGTPEQIRRDPKVISSYLGADEELVPTTEARPVQPSLEPR